MLSGLVAMATLGAPGVEDLRGGIPPGVEEMEDLWMMGAGAGGGVGGAGDRRTTWGEENSNNLAATPTGAGLGV